MKFNNFVSLFFNCIFLEILGISNADIEEETGLKLFIIKIHNEYVATSLLETKGVNIKNTIFKNETCSVLIKNAEDE